MRRLTYLLAVVATIGATSVTTGCARWDSGSPGPAGADSTAGPPAASPTGTPERPTVDPTADPTGTQSAQPDPGNGPDSPTSRSQCPSGDLAGGLLRAIRTGHHATYDRVVFEFCGESLPAYHLRYVSDVRQDPSDRPVSLKGQAFVRVVFDGGTIDTAPIAPDPKTAPRYTGPTRLTPDHPVVKDVAIAGDFERVLSFGIGIDHPTGVHVQKLASPPRLAVDFWSATPTTLVWPASTRAKAQELQDAADEGHQPWFLPGSPLSMSTYYAQQVLGWSEPDVQRISDTVYQVSQPNTNEAAILTLVQPIRRGAGGVWIVADVAR